MNRDMTIKKEHICSVTVFGLFLFNMLYNLTHSNLGGDEWVEYYYSQASIRTGELYDKIVSTFQPPLYNFIMHFWLKVSTSILWFRLFNVFIGLGSGIFLYFTLKKLCNNKVALFGVCALSMCYRWIYCIQECAEYALMLFFIFAAIFFWEELVYKYSLVKMWFFIISCVGAVYSQYGSVFVIAPILCIYYFSSILDKNVDKKRKKHITISYIISLLIFALPLYKFFTSIQMANNEVSGHTVPIREDFVLDFPFVLGKIIGYFYSSSTNIEELLWSIISVALIITSVYFLMRKDTEKIKKNLLITLCVAYVIHYILVKLHIYAMVHPGQSSGFYCRYSYFYIPLFMVVIPIIFSEVLKTQKNVKKICIYTLCTLLSICCFISFVRLLDNWEKGVNDEIAQVWIDKEGWNEVTYLLGSSKYAFMYYTQNLQIDTSNVIINTDVSNLPLEFWVWSSHWGYTSCDKVIEKVKALNYDISMYVNYDYPGAQGTLMFCSYLGEYEDLNLDTNEFNVSNISITDDGEIKLDLKFDSESENTPIFNSQGYRFTYHVVDLDYNKIEYYNKKYALGSWILDEGYEIVINPILPEGTSSYIIQLDILKDDNKYMSKYGFKMPEIKVVNNEIVY